MSESYRIGDAGQSFDYDYQDSGGNFLVLTGQTVQVVFLAPSGALKTRTAALIAHPDTGAADSAARYTLIGTDLDEEGVWFREFHSTGSFTDTTEPVSFYVGPRLA